MIVSRSFILILSVCALIIAISFYHKLGLFKGDKVQKEYISKKLIEKLKVKRNLPNSNTNIYSRRFNYRENYNKNKSLIKNKLIKYRDLKIVNLFRLLENTDYTDSSNLNNNDNSINTHPTPKTLTSNDNSGNTDYSTSTSYDSSTNYDPNLENTYNRSIETDNSPDNESNTNTNNNFDNSTDNVSNNSTDNSTENQNSNNSTENQNSTDNNFDISTENQNSTDNNNSSENQNEINQEELDFIPNVTYKSYFLFNYLYNNSFLQEKFQKLCIEPEYDFPTEYFKFDLNYKEYNNTALLFKRYEYFVDFNSSMNAELKNVFKKISNFEQVLTENEITIFKFVGSSANFLVLLLCSIIGWLTCCACAWYDYCPIICKKSKSHQYSILTKQLPISFMVLISLGLIIPTYISITDYKLVNDSIQFTLCNSLRMSSIIYNGRDFVTTVDVNQIYWSGFNQPFLTTNAHSSSANNNSWLDKEYSFFEEIDKSQLYINYKQVKKFLQDFSEMFSDFQNSSLDKFYNVIDLYSSLYDIKNKTENSTGSGGYSLVLPKFIREFTAPKPTDKPYKIFSNKLSFNKLNNNLKEKNLFKILFEQNNTNYLNKTNEYNIKINKNKRYLANETFEDSEILESSYNGHEYFESSMVNYLDKYILDFILLLKSTSNSIKFLRENKVLLSEYKEDVLIPLFRKNLEINELNAFYTYFIEKIASGELQMGLSYTNIFVTSNQIFLVFLTIIIFLANYYRIKKFKKIFTGLKIIANVFWIFSGFIVILLIISIIFFNYFFSFNYFYAHNLFKYSTTGNKTEMSFSQCLYDFEDMQLDEKYIEIDQHMDNVTFFMLRSHIANQNQLLNFNNFLKKMKIHIEDYSDISKAFYKEPEKVDNALALFNDMIGYSTKMPFQHYFNCKEKINIEMVFEKDNCNYFFFEVYTENIDLTDNDFCFMISKISPETMEKIMEKYIKDCDNSTLNLRDAIIEAHKNLYYFEDSFNKFVDYTSQEIIFQLISKVADLCTQVVAVEMDSYYNFTIDSLNNIGLNYDTYNQIYSKSQEKDQKTMKQILNYIFRKTTSCSYYKTLIKKMIDYILKNKIKNFFKINRTYLILLVFQILLTIFGLINAKLNYNGVYKEKNTYEFKTISKTES